MKFLKLIVFIPFLMAASYPLEGGADKIEWLDFNSGFAKAIDEGKIAVIDCYTDWCGWCKVMDKKTFSDSGVIQRLKEKYISIKFNPEKPGSYTTGGGDTLNGKQLLMALSNNKPSGYPTFFFFVPQTKQMFQVAGYQDIAKFNATLDDLERYQKTAIEKAN